jgi:hypothetical protein
VLVRVNHGLLLQLSNVSWVLCCAVVCCGVQVTIPPKVAREAVNAEELRLQVNAAFIAGLPQVCCYGSMSF